MMGDTLYMKTNTQYRLTCDGPREYFQTYEAALARLKYLMPSAVIRVRQDGITQAYGSEYWADHPQGFAIAAISKVATR